MPSTDSLSFGLLHTHVIEDISYLRHLRHSPFFPIMSRSIRLLIDGRRFEFESLLGEPSAAVTIAREMRKRPWTGDSAADLQKRTLANLAPSP
jgi:hypothetical protein